MPGEVQSKILILFLNIRVAESITKYCNTRRYRKMNNTMPVRQSVKKLKDCINACNWKKGSIFVARNMTIEFYFL